LRNGAQRVDILYRREKQDMPAEASEVREAEEEGIQVHTLTAPVKVVGQGGKVTGMELVRMELGEFDKSGRKTPRPLKGSEYSVDCDMVIEAIGQRPDTSVIGQDGVKSGKGGTILADTRTLATGRPGVFAGGDAVSGAATVIEAIAAGQRAASSIKRYLRGEELGPRMDRPDLETFELPDVTKAEVIEKARVVIREIEPRERSKSFKEVVSGYGLDEAIEEASRCLRCDVEVGGE